MSLNIGDLVVISENNKSKFSSDMLAIVLEVHPEAIFDNESVYKLQKVSGGQIWANDQKIKKVSA